MARSNLFPLEQLFFIASCFRHGSWRSARRSSRRLCDRPRFELRNMKPCSRFFSAFPCFQVMVRLSSIGFCLAELADVHTKLFKMAPCCMLADLVQVQPTSWYGQGELWR